MNRLQQLREAAALSRADLARRSDVTQSVIEQLEGGAQLSEAERAVEVPGETPVEDIAVILNKLADALGANLFVKNISVTPGELLGPARADLPATAGAASATYSGDETQPALPLIGVNYALPASDLPPEARSHNETETPEDIDAALDQLARNAQITASEEAAETGADEVRPEPNWPEGPVSPAASTSTDSAESQPAGLTPSGGTETINMAELPDTLPIGVLPDTPSYVENKEIPPPTNPQEKAIEADREFASQETQEIYIPPEVLATSTRPAGIAPAGSGEQETQTFELPQDIQNLPGEAETIDTPSSGKPETGVSTKPAEATVDAPTMKFNLSEVRAQAVKDTTELEKEEMAPALATAAEPSSAVMATHPESAGPSETNLGLPTAHAVEEVAPNPTPPLAPPVEPTPLEKEAATPAQDDALLTKAQPEQQPEMRPYVTPGPSAAQQNRYKLPVNTAVPLVVGVAGVMGWYLWRSWRRSRGEADRVAPYNKKK